MFDFMYFWFFRSLDLKLIFFVFNNGNKNDSQQFNNSWRDGVSLMAFFIAPNSKPKEGKYLTSKYAAQIIDGLNAIKLRAKSHLFHEYEAGMGVESLWLRQRLSIPIYLSVEWQYDITRIEKPEKYGQHHFSHPGWRKKAHNKTASL
jgi:hypothetical protein